MKLKTRPKNKYGNRKVTVDGITFDSTKEGNRYLELKFLLATGKIKELELHKRFVLDDGFVDKTGYRWRDYTYICDFYYYDIEKKEWIIEDVKSEATKKDKTYRNKKRFMAKYGLIITEV